MIWGWQDPGMNHQTPPHPITSYTQHPPDATSSHHLVYAASSRRHLIPSPRIRSILQSLSTQSARTLYLVTTVQDTMTSLMDLSTSQWISTLHISYIRPNSFLHLNKSKTKKQHVLFVLVFSKCFRTGFWAFSELEYTLKGVTNSCNLWVISIKVRRFCLRLPTKGVFLCLRMRRGIKCRMQKLGYDILRYVSKFRRSDRDN